MCYVTISCCCQVVTLDIQHNELSTIPSCILELPNLTVLNISHNKLTIIPRLDRWSSSLVSLDISHNKIAIIQGEPCAPAICTLNLSSNELNVIPQCICNFVTLQLLDISNNVGICTLPVWMYKLKELKQLNLNGLKNLSGVPRCIQQNPKRIIKYLKSRSLSTKAYYRMKLMLVGKANQGKTTLIARLQGKCCGNKSTIGVDVSEWKYRPFRTKKTFHFSVWDFGGHEEYYATHQYFLSERAIYIVLFNLKQGDEGARELLPWLNNIATRAPRSCVLIVGTHLDEIPLTEREEQADRVLETAANIASRFASKLQIEQVLAVGLDDPLEGVSELQDTIYHCAAAYKLNSGEFVMGQKIPVSYYKLDKHILWIQKQVRGLNHEPIMHHEEYKALVQELHLSDIGDDDELKMATLFLTDVGTLLHYGDYGHHLDELYFVDPKWLCDVMAKIVSVKEMNPFVQDGVLHTKDIPLLYHNEKFPWQYCQQYLTLLDRFEIAFALDRHRILIPSLLSEVPPDGMGLSEMNAVPFYTRLVIFNTSTMPSGFWSRLISRIMHAIPNITSTIHSERNASTINAKSSTSPNEHILASNPTQQSAEYSASFSLSLLSDFSALQGRLLYWRTGLFYENTHVIFRVQSLFETHHHKQGIEITASTSPLGRVIVGQVIDFIGTLVKDWYPGLEDRGPLEQTVLCCECLKLKRSNPHQFNVQDCHALINQNMTTIDCGYTKDPSIQNHSVPLADIVPDLLLQDISMKFLLNLSELEFSEGNDSVLGIGGFGKVFRGKCKGQSVAIKRYLNGNEALGELRKEAILLQKSYHPCLVGLVGVCVHPILALVLEEAPLGSLEKPCLKEKAVLHRIVVQRIAVQVAAALKFLHSGGIIFRDLKAANVLLWSLDPGSLCHCKVTDFGIATHITPLGTRGLTGTKGFIAPEVLHISKKKEHSLYDHKVDIFSFGMLLYQVISRRHPFHNIPPVKIDSAVECGERPTLHDVPQAENAYFYLTRLMEQCWQGDPRKRPTADEIIEKLSLSSFQSAMTVRPVPCSSFSLRTGCVVSAKDFANIGCSHRENELWVCSDGNNGAEISIYLTNTMAAPSKTIIEGNQVQCIGLCGEQIWIASRAGIGDGAIDIFSIVTREAIKRIHLNDQSVSCIAFFNKTVYCGTLDGFCLSFSQGLLTACSSKPRSKHISDNAVDGICATKDCLWLSYGNSITFINQDTLETVGTIKRAKYCDEFVGHLQINSSNTTIWSCLIKRTTFISAWDGVSKTHTFDINVKDYMNSICQLSVEDTIITAFIPVLDNVWVGIKSGHILVFFSKELLMWFHPYAWYVRFLLCIPCEGPCGTEKSMVISGGKGFRSSLVPGLCEYPEMSGVGTLIVWEAFSSKMSRQISLLQSQSSTYLESHESVRDMIQRGEFEDSMFLAESSSHAPGVQDDQEKVASEAESITTDHI